MGGTGTKNAPSAFDVRPDVLTDIDITSIRLRKRAKDLMKKSLRGENCAHIFRQAKNYAAQYGLVLKSKEPKDADSLASLVKELDSSSRHYIRLLDDDKGHLSLSATMCVSEDYRTYFIPLAPTYGLRPEAGLLARRFIRLFDDRYSLGTMLTNSTLDSLMESYEEQIDYQETEYHRTKDENDKPENFFDQEWIQAHKDYEEGSEIQKKLEEYKALEPLDDEAMMKFVPQNVAEELLLETIREGLDIMTNDVDIWTQTYISQLSEKELEDIYSNAGIIEFSQLCHVIWDFDDMLDIIVEDINSYVNCGSEMDYIVSGGIIPEDGPFDNNGAGAVLGYIQKLADILSEKIPGLLAKEMDVHERLAA